MPPPELDVGWDCAGGAGWVLPALSVVEVVGAPAGTVDPGVLDVGNGGGVLEGGSVGFAVSVGGTGVGLGTAASVSATIVNAAASAVCPTSTGLAVGVP